MTTKAKPAVDWTRERLLPLSSLYLMMERCAPLNFRVYDRGYYSAFKYMDTAKDSYGDDSGESVVAYALGNFTSARTAKGIKKPLAYVVGEADMVEVDPVGYIRESLKEHLRRVQQPK